MLCDYITLQTLISKGSSLAVIDNEDQCNQSTLIVFVPRPCSEMHP